MALLIDPFTCFDRINKASFSTSIFSFSEIILKCKKISFVEILLNSKT